MSDLDPYDYTLPRELIAQEPLARRSDARLLVADRATERISHHYVRDLPEILWPGDRLVLNDTRVVPAALAGRRTKTGGRWQGLFLSSDETGLWRILCKARGKLSPGDSITLVDREARDALELALVQQEERGVWIALPKLDDVENAFEVLERVGRVPLPPYIRGGHMVDRDLKNYQTVFAVERGAIAAPTAGLHFTAELLEEFRQGGIGVTRITLHVGLDTFRPIHAQRLADHKMHSEWARLSTQAAEDLLATRAAGGRIVAVGTTAVRTLETAARHGRIVPFSGETDLFIRPPYNFKAVDALLTNFHLPKTTLLILVRTFGGDDLVRRAYDEAIDEQYRFYSYGDAMLIL